MRRDEFLGRSLGVALSPRVLLGKKPRRKMSFSQTVLSREIGDGTCVFKGQLYGLTWDTVAGQDKCFKWANPPDTATFTQSANLGQAPAALWPDPTTGLLYFANQAGGTNPNFTRPLKSIDPGTLAVTTIATLNTGADRGIINSPVCTDGTYLYFLNDLPDKAVIYKTRLSDGALITTYTLVTAGTTTGANILFDRASGFLFAGGAGDGIDPWIAKLATDFSSETVAFITGLGLIDDDWFVNAGYIWMTNEDSAVTPPDQVAKISTADLSYTLFSVGDGYAHDGMCFDGTNIQIAARVDYLLGPTNSPVTAINPATGAVVSSQLFPMVGINELQPVIGSGLVAISSPSANHGSGGSTVTYLGPTGGPPLQLPSIARGAFF